MSGRNRLPAVPVEPDDGVDSETAEKSRNGGLLEMRIAREQTASGRHRKACAVGDKGADLADERHFDHAHAEIVRPCQRSPGRALREPSQPLELRSIATVSPPRLANTGTMSRI